LLLKILCPTVEYGLTEKNRLITLNFYTFVINSVVDVIIIIIMMSTTTYKYMQ